MKLYELTSQAIQLMDALSDEAFTDEQREECVQAFLREASEKKLESVAQVIRTLAAEGDAFKAEAGRFAQKAGVSEKAQERLKSAVLAHLQVLGVSEAPAGLFKFSVCSNGGKLPVSLKVEPTELPAAFQRVSIQPDMEKIREQLEAGTPLEFAELGARGCHVRVR